MQFSRLNATNGRADLRKKRVRLCTFSTCTAMQVMPRSSSSILNPKPKMSLTLPTCWSFQLGAGISTPWWLPLLGSRFSMADWLVLAHLVALHAVGRACMSVGRLPLAHIWSLEHGRLACTCLHAVYVGRSVDRSCILQALTLGLCLYLWSLEHARLASACMQSVELVCRSVGCLLHIWSLDHGRLACAYCTQYMSVGRLIDPALKAVACKR